MIKSYGLSSGRSSTLACSNVIRSLACRTCGSLASRAEPGHELLVALDEGQPIAGRMSRMIWPVTAPVPGPTSRMRRPVGRSSRSATTTLPQSRVTRLLPDLNRRGRNAARPRDKRAAAREHGPVV